MFQFSLIRGNKKVWRDGVPLTAVYTLRPSKHIHHTTFAVESFLLRTYVAGFLRDVYLINMCCFYGVSNHTKCASLAWHFGVVTSGWVEIISLWTNTLMLMFLRLDTSLRHWICTFLYRNKGRFKNSLICAYVQVNTRRVQI